jgi:hypothetical protein
MLIIDNDQMVCFKHSILFTVIDEQVLPCSIYNEWRPTQVLLPGLTISLPHQNPTTSFLTATLKTYASGAGITAAAGTRLALHVAALQVHTKSESFQ